jgi:hypothetical protein
MSGCVIKPVDGLEVSSRTSTIPYEIVFQESSDPASYAVPYINIMHLDQNGKVVFTQIGGLTNVAFFATDALGQRWTHGTSLIDGRTTGWYLNKDASHPTAKWKKRFRFAYNPYQGNGVWGAAVAALTFKGTPSGAFADSTAACLNNLQSQGGIVMGTYCQQGDTVTVYAIGD